MSNLVTRGYGAGSCIITRGLGIVESAETVAPWNILTDIRRINSRGFNIKHITAVDLKDIRSLRVKPDRICAIVATTPAVKSLSRIRVTEPRAISLPPLRRFNA